jgi:hypothetical protein
MGFIPMRFLTDDTNSISNCKIPASVGADPRACPFPGRARRCAPYQRHRERGHSSFLLLFAGLPSDFYVNMVICQGPHELPSEEFATTF